jgi:hypothetical protein
MRDAVFGGFFILHMGYINIMMTQMTNLVNVYVVIYVLGVVNLNLRKNAVLRNGNVVVFLWHFNNSFFYVHFLGSFFRNRQ